MIGGTQMRGNTGVGGGREKGSAGEAAFADGAVPFGSPAAHSADVVAFDKAFGAEHVTAERDVVPGCRVDGEAFAKRGPNPAVEGEHPCT